MPPAIPSVDIKDDQVAHLDVAAFDLVGRGQEACLWRYAQAPAPAAALQTYTVACSPFGAR